MEPCGENGGRAEDYPWLKHYPAHLDWDTRFEGAPFHALLSTAARDFPDKPLTDFFGRETSFAEMDALADRVARGLQNLGIRRGARIGVYLPNCPQYAAIVFGALRAGATLVNISPLYSIREILHIIEDSGCDIVFTATHVSLFGRIRSVAQITHLRAVIRVPVEDALPPLKRLWARLSGKAGPDLRYDAPFIDWARFVANRGDFTDPGCDPDRDIALIQYTGGTTGRPKGAMLTHANLTINLEQVGTWEPDVTRGKGRILGALPFFHAYAFTVILGGAVRLGLEIVILAKPEPEAISKALARKPVISLPAVPTMLTALLDGGPAVHRALGKLEFSLCGGAPLAEDIRERLETVAGRPVVREGYGLTEASPIVTATPAAGSGKPGSIGLPVPGTELRFVDIDDPARVLPYGETGEICVRGPQVMLGYWERSLETDAVLIDGWLHTGDIGYMDEDGFTFIIDRKKDMILVGGFNVYPRIIEEALLEHPEVAQATVIGVADRYYGECPKAFIVATDSAAPPSESEILVFLNSRLGKMELPRHIEFRDSLPVTAVGKLSKKELVEEERRRYDTPDGPQRAATGTG